MGLVLDAVRAGVRLAALRVLARVTPPPTPTPLHIVADTRQAEQALANLRAEIPAQRVRDDEQARRRRAGDAS